ncbi:MAG: hypothetical protein HYY03_04920, partial [Chloroflexi bacterium]|nr:hypothetical protein [Chloroflexota bacterium]
MRYARFLVLGLLTLLAVAVIALLGRGLGGPTVAVGPNTITVPDTGTNGETGWYTSLALDAAGNPVISYYDAADGKLTVLHCGNPACTAGNTIAAPDTAGNIGAFSSLALDAAGNPVVSYCKLQDGGFFDRCDDLKVLHCGNPTCTAGNTITSPDTFGNVGGYTSLELDPLGNPVVSYYDEANHDLKVLHCNDPACAGGDESIALPQTAGTAGRYTSLALDGLGNPVVSYCELIFGTLGYSCGGLKVLHCNDPNCDSAVAGPESITSPDTAGSAHISLALDSSGNPVVSYCSAGESLAGAEECRDLKVLHCGDPTCASGNVITSPDTFRDAGWYTSLALDGSGKPVISYFESVDRDLKVLHCGDATCTSGNSITFPDVGGDGGEFTSLALNPAGNPVVSYCLNKGVLCGHLKVLHCDDPNCAGDDIIASPDTAGDVGLWSSLALDGAGNPVVAYADFTNGDLKVLHCGNPTCTAGNSVVSGFAAAVPGSIVGSDTSLVLDTAGNPVISTYDGGNGDLWVIRCGNPTCTSGNVISTPHTAGNVGQFTSLALDSAGNPVVSYYDATNGDLFVLHCGNATCSAGNTHASPDTTGNVGFLTSLELDASGNPVVSYCTRIGAGGPTTSWCGDVKVLHCGNPTCTAGNTIASPEPAGQFIWPDLALDSLGNPVVSYCSMLPGLNVCHALNVLHCGDATCTSGNTIASPDTSDDFGTDVGWMSSIVVDPASGNPVVSYQQRFPKFLGQPPDRDLKVLRCGSPTCTAGNVISTPDGPGDVGWYTSLELDASGNPVVSYGDFTNHDLKVLRCNDPSCVNSEVNLADPGLQSGL